MLIDGRNRLRACVEAGVDVVHEALGAHYSEEMILDLIVSLNMARRQLNPGQRAMVGIEYEARLAEAAKARQASAGGDKFTRQAPDQGKPLPADLRERRRRESSERAARVVGASGRAVQQAKKVAAAARGTARPDQHPGGSSS